MKLFEGDDDMNSERNWPCQGQIVEGARKYDIFQMELSDNKVGVVFG